MGLNHDNKKWQLWKCRLTSRPCTLRSYGLIIPTIAITLNVLLSVKFLTCFMAETIRLIIEGNVQGVFYRQSAKEKADKLGISGTVRNLKDGSVEIIATGNPGQLEQLIQWCNLGPPKAVVTNITSTPLPLQPFNNFVILRS